MSLIRIIILYFIFLGLLFGFIFSQPQKDISRNSNKEDSTCIIIPKEDNHKDYFIIIQSLEPSFYQNVVLGLLAILVPFIIAILSEYLREETKANNPIVRLDLQIILNYIFKPKLVIASILISLLIPMFLAFGKTVLSILSLLIFIICVGQIVSVIKNSFLWINENKEFIRFKYLRKTKKIEEIEYHWSTIWQIKKLSDEAKFLNIFIEKIDEIIRNKKYSVLGNLLLTFFQNMDNLSNSTISEVKILHRFLEFRSLINKQIHDSQEMNDFCNSEVIENLDSILRKIEIISIFNTKNSFKYFSEIEKHISENLTNEDYVSQILNNLIDIIFNEIIKNANIIIEHIKFPQNWKISLENINRQDFVLKTIRNRLILRIPDFVLSSDQYKQAKFRLICKLFISNIDSILFSKIILFTSIDSRNRIETLLKLPIDFHVFTEGTIYVESNPDTEIEKYTYQISIELFKNKYSINELKKNMIEIDIEGFKENTHLYLIQTWYRSIIENLIKYLSIK